jgi:Fe-S cluster assembly iron-binding protein IscA
MRKLLVQVTERAGVELRRLLTEHVARPRQAVRLRLDSDGQLAMTIDEPHVGDSVIRRDNVLVLIVESRLSTRLAQRILDFGPTMLESRAGFTLGWSAMAGQSPEGN